MEKENKKQLNIPKLRFSEFDGKWEIKRLEEIGENIIGLTYSPKDVTNNLLSPIVLRSSNIKDGRLVLDDLVRVSCDISEKLKIRENDILICTRNGSQSLIGKNVIIKKVSDRFTFGAFMSVFRSNTNYFNNYIFKSENFREQINKNLGARINQITTGNLNKFKFYFPNTKLEQQKIADFLSSVDNWINNLKQQKENLESYKKGMMQKIFSQEIRFKDENGEDFEEWRDFLFKDIVNHFGGTALEEFVSDDGEYNFISIGNYSVDGKYLNNNQKIILNEKTKTKLLNKNDLVMVLNDKTASGDLIGSTILINEDNKFIYNQRSERIICKEVLYPIFAWHILNSKFFRSEIVKKSQGGTQIYINFGTIEKIKISIPCIEEQKNIADFLSNINNLIEIKYKEINNAEEWKKGLMQQMFV